MDVLLSALTFAVVTWMVAGFINPAWALRWRADPDRRGVLFWGLAALSVLAVLFLIFWE